MKTVLVVEDEAVALEDLRDSLLEIDQDLEITRGAPRTPLARGLEGVAGSRHRHELGQVGQRHLRSGEIGVIVGVWGVVIYEGSPKRS